MRRGAIEKLYQDRLYQKRGGHVRDDGRVSSIERAARGNEPSTYEFEKRGDILLFPIGASSAVSSRH